MTSCSLDSHSGAAAVSRWYTGHVTAGGSICIAVLTLSGSANSWTPDYSVESILNVVIANMCAHAAGTWSVFMGDTSCYILGQRVHMHDLRDYRSCEAQQPVAHSSTRPSCSDCLPGSMRATQLCASLLTKLLHRVGASLPRCQLQAALRASGDPDSQWPRRHQRSPAPRPQWAVLPQPSAGLWPANPLMQLLVGLVMTP